MAWYLLLLQFAILSTVECMLNYSRPYNFTYNGSLVTLKSLTISQNLITFIAVERNYQVMTVSLNPGGSKTSLYNLTSAQLVRSSATNILGSASNDYLTFTTNQVTRYFNNFSSSSVYLLSANSNESVVEVSYGPTNDEAAVIVKNLTGSYYQLLYLLNGSKLTTKTLPVLISANFTKCQSYSGSLYLLFEAKLLIYSFDSALTLKKTISFTNPSAVRFSVNSSLLVYSQGNIGYVASVNNSYAVVDSLNIGEPIIDLKVASPYLLISSLTTFYQYDMDIKQTIHTFTHTLNFTGFNYENHKNSILVFYQAGNPSLYAYKYDTLAPCLGVCPTCLVTYDYNATILYCSKNFSAVVPVIPNNTNTTNATTNSINATNTSNITNTTNTNNNTMVNNTISNSEEITIELVFIVGKTLTFQTTNFLPKFVSSLTIFLDDLWYYKFHRCNYTSWIIFFTKRVDWLNYFRFSTWFFDIQAQLDKVVIGADENTFYLQEISPHKNNPENVYFLNSSKDIYLDGIVLNLIIYMASKILHALLFALKNCHPVFNQLYLWIRDSTKWWTFLLMLLESNMMRLAFFATLQFQVFFCYNFVTKLNLVLSTLTLAALLLYTAVFNLSIFRFQKQSAAKNVLVYTKYGRNSFIFEGFCFTFRNLLRGFLQALLIKSYVHLIIGLALSDLLFLSLCLKFKSRFVNRAIFFSIAFYGLSFFVFDAVLVVHLYHSSWLETRIDYDFMTFVILCVVVGFFILSILILLKETFKFILFIVCGCWRTPKKSLVKAQEHDHSIEIRNSKQAQAIVLHKKSLEFEQNHEKYTAIVPIKRIESKTKLMKNNTIIKNLKKQNKPKKQIFIKASNQINFVYIPAEKVLKPHPKQTGKPTKNTTFQQGPRQEIIK